MKFCSNQRIKFNRKKDEEVIVNVPIPEEANLLPATDIPPLPFQPSNGESGGTVLDRFIPVPESFSGLNNPFRFRDDKIREARKLICTRRLGLEDLTKTKKLKKRSRPLPLQESRLLWRQHGIHLNPDHHDRLNLNPDQPSTSASTSSASSECSGNEADRFFSRRKRKFYNWHPCSNNNRDETCNKLIQQNAFKNKTEEMIENGTETIRRIMTRNRAREFGLGVKKKVIGRRMIAPGIFEILVQHD